MAQPLIAAYFNTRKRAATDDLKVDRASKVLIVDEGEGILSAKSTTDGDAPQIIKSAPIPKKNTEIRALRRKPNSTPKGQLNIESFVNKVLSNETTTSVGPREENHVQQVTSCEIQNGMDKVNGKTKDASLNKMKLKLGKSSRLADLKASLSKFEDLQNRRKQFEKSSYKISFNSPISPELQNFETISLEVQLSPQKKLHASPKKDLTVRKNLLNLLSPTKNSVSLCTSPLKKIEDESFKPALKLPRKYSYVVEMFRAIDTVSQLLYNRKETITFSKLKPAVENLMKRNLSKRCLAQIKKMYPDSFKYQQEKLRVFGTGKREEKWELVLTPLIGGADQINSEILLSRRKVLFAVLLDKVKDYHSEFLKSLEPPMDIPKEEIKRWHQEFDLESVPDIEEDELPEPPEEMKMLSGQEVLEKAREMFGHNSRMQQALERLSAKNKEQPIERIQSNISPPSILRGIPKALLEKVRQRQAAKALVSMTRSADKEQELKVYSHLPELARLTKSLFVSEKKNVLKLDDVVEKLGDCYRVTLTKIEMEEHIKLLVKELPEWLVLHQSISKIWHLKQINRDVDINAIRNKLEIIVTSKSSQCNFNAMQLTVK